MTYTIIPDCAGLWVKSDQANPLSIDWPQETELAHPELQKRVMRDLSLIRNKNVVIVQKVEANTLKDGFSPLSERYSIVNVVQKNFSKIYETSFFEVYQ